VISRPKKIGALEDQVKKVVTNAGELTEKVKANPSLLLRRPKEEKRKTESTNFPSH